MPSPAPRGPLRFGPFEADPRTHELRRDGRRVPIQEQPFQVLMALLECPGQLVSRRELCARLWPGDTFVEYDAGLNTAVRKLRKALQDPSDQPLYIETLPKLGYRFNGSVVLPASPREDQRQPAAAPVELAAGVPTAPAIARLDADDGRGWNRGAPVLGIVGVALVLVATFATWVGSRAGDPTV